MKKTEIYFAGGCFWGMEKYFSLISGVLATDVGFANGLVRNPTYEQVKHTHTGYAETIHIIYDADQVSLNFLLDMYFKVIDPFSVNRQGNDIGSQYRTGIYYTNKEDEQVVTAYIGIKEKELGQPIAVEHRTLINYYCADEEHQNYLAKNPNGYCHIGEDDFEMARNATDN